MPRTITEASPTITTSAYSIPAATTTGVPTSQTGDAVVQILIDPVNLALGDDYEIKVYHGVNGTQRLVWEQPVENKVGQLIAIPPMLMAAAWDVTLVKVAGTDRSIPVSYRTTTGGTWAVVSSTATIGTTERSLPADTTTGVPTTQTDDALVQAYIHFASMTNGDKYRIRIYERINGSAVKTIYDAFIEGVQDGAYATPAFELGAGWDITVTKVSGTDRTVTWSLVKVT